MAEQGGSGSDPISVANRWITAYNGKDTTQTTDRRSGASVAIHARKR